MEGVGMAALIQFANGAPGIKYTLDKTKLLIGRSNNKNDICLPCGFVSKHHAIVEAVESIHSATQFDFYIEDLDSTNHTYVNDKPIKRTKLEDGDIVRIGKTTLKFDASGDIAELEAIDMEEHILPASQSRTWNFSRRLRVLGVD